MVSVTCPWITQTAVAPWKWSWTELNWNEHISLVRYYRSMVAQRFSLLLYRKKVQSSNMSASCGLSVQNLHETLGGFSTWECPLVFLVLTHRQNQLSRLKNVTPDSVLALESLQTKQNSDLLNTCHYFDRQLSNLWLLASLQKSWL